MLLWICGMADFTADMQSETNQCISYECYLPLHNNLQPVKGLTVKEDMCYRPASAQRFSSPVKNLADLSDSWLQFKVRVIGKACKHLRNVFIQWRKLYEPSTYVQLLDARTTDAHVQLNQRILVIFAYSFTDPEVSEWVSEWVVLYGTSAQLGYTVSFTSVVAKKIYN